MVTENPNIPNIENLSPEQQAVLLQRLQAKGENRLTSKIDAAVPNKDLNKGSRLVDSNFDPATDTSVNGVKTNISTDQILQDSAKQIRPLASNRDTELLQGLEDGQFLDGSGNSQIDLQDFMNRLNNPEERDLDIKNRLN